MQLEQVKKRNIVYLLASGILLTMFLVALLSSKGAFGDPGDSGTVDEIAHIPSGYTYVADQDFRLNPEHPPLAKALAGLPLVLKNFRGPETNWSWEGLNQWESGWYMIYHAGNDPKEVFFWSRLPMMLLMVLLGIILFKWAKELYGSKVGLIVLLLYAFYPDVLAHGRLVTTDVAAALGYTLAVYFFDRLTREITWRNILYASLALALAQLLKFSAFLLFIIFFILVIVKSIMERKQGGFLRQFWVMFKSFFAVSFLSLIFVWIAYIPFVFNMSPEITHRVIDVNLSSGPGVAFFRNILHSLEGNVITRAIGHYLLGMVMVVVRVEGGNNTFILGHLSDKAISWYFPVAWLLKTSITIIVGTFLSLAYLVWRFPRDQKNKWLLAVILMPVIVYWGFTLKGSLNIGIRHLMPTVPFVLLLIGFFVKDLLAKRNVWTNAAVGVFLVYFVGSTLWHYPNFIAYFNEFTPKDQRYTRLIDSSLDWGQDLLRLKKYIEENKINSIKIDYFGGSVPSYYISQAQEWHSSYGPTTGWLAVSATFYQSSKLTGAKEGTWSYEWLDKFEPKEIIGGSILVFNISSDDLVKNPPVSPYPIIRLDKPSVPVANPMFTQQQ